MSCIGISEAIEAAAAGVAFVAFHDGGPLMSRHGAGAGVGEQVDEDIVSGQEEEVVVRGLEKGFALGRVVQRMGSTLLMRNGSMIVLAIMRGLSKRVAASPIRGRGGR